MKFVKVLSKNSGLLFGRKHTIVYGHCRGVPKFRMKMVSVCSGLSVCRFIMFIALEMNDPGSIGYRHSDLWICLFSQ